MTCNRCVDIVVGGSCGSEGKGGLISRIAGQYSAMCRSSASSAAHTIVYNGKPYTFHMIPCGSLQNDSAQLIITAATQIDMEHLKKEIGWLKELNKWLLPNGKPRLTIDSNATIVESIDCIAENGGRMPDCGDLYFHPRDCEIHNQQLNGTCMGCSKLPPDSAWGSLGSTTHGGGANLIRKAARNTKMAILAGQPLDLAKYFRSKLPEGVDHDKLQEYILDTVNNGPITDWSSAIDIAPIQSAKDNEFTKQFVGDTVSILNRLIDKNETILLEGTQGSMLSVHFGPWPKCTSRDTNASNWAMEAGISPLAIRDIYCVFRTFPIRVAGNSGPMPGEEITWEEVTKFAGSKEPIKEVTSATKRLRRVSVLGEEHVRRALDLNRPTKLMLSFVDYLSHEDRNKSSWDSLTQKTRDWITILESKMGIFFNYLSTGPAPEHMIIRKTPGELIGQIQGRGTN